MVTLSSLTSLFTAVITAFFGAFVFFRQPHSRLHRAFGLFAVSMSLWAFTEYELRAAESLRRATYWLSLGRLWPVSIALLVHFIVVFTGNYKGRARAAVVGFAHVPAAVFVAVNLVALPLNLVRVSWGWAPVPVVNPYTLLSHAWGIVWVLTALFLCLRYYRASTSIQVKKMSKHVLFGLSAPIVFGIITEVILPLASVQVMELTASMASVTVVFFAYAIWRHDLFALTPSSAAESIISTMSDPLFLVNTEHEIRSVNNAALTLLGYQEFELIGQSISKIFSAKQSDDETRRTTFQKVLSTGAVNDVESELQTKDGRRVPVSLSWSTTQSREGKTLGITFIGRDITERIRMRETLQKSYDELEDRVEERTRELKVTNTMLRDEIAERMTAEERLAAEKEHLAVTLRSIGDGVITTGIDGRVTLLNNIAEKLTGWDATEALGKSLSDVLKIIDATSREPLSDPVATVMKTNDIVSFGPAVTLVARDGTERQISETAAPIRDCGGKIWGIVLVFRDMSDKWKLEEEFYKIRRIESIAVLAGGIAHDFNNILTGIMTNLFVARTQIDADSETYELVSEAEKAAFRASTLTRQLLTFSKGTPPIRERHELRRIIEEAAGYSLSGANVDYHVSADAGLWDVEVDRGQIDQALNHIIVNAEQAMPNGGTIEITATNEEVDESVMPSLKPGKYVRVSIRDEGVGIPKANQHRIFDPYFTTKNEANGLGLSNAFAITRKHGGSIHVESEEHKGTTVFMYLPACPDGEQKDGEDAPVPVAVEKPGKAKVLIMDDEEYIRKSTSKLLNHLGYETHTAKDGAEAVELIRKNLEASKPFDMVILDLTIPGGMGAKDTIVKVRAISPDLPVFVSSGYANDPVMTDFGTYGFQGVISKPYEIEELNEKLRSISRG